MNIPIIFHVNLTKPFRIKRSFNWPLLRESASKYSYMAEWTDLWMNGIGVSFRTISELRIS